MSVRVPKRSAHSEEQSAAKKRKAEKATDDKKKKAQAKYNVGVKGYEKRDTPAWCSKDDEFGLLCDVGVCRGYGHIVVFYSVIPSMCGVWPATNVRKNGAGLVVN